MDEEDGAARLRGGVDGGGRRFEVGAGRRGVAAAGERRWGGDEVVVFLAVDGGGFGEHAGVVGDEFGGEIWGGRHFG